MRARQIVIPEARLFSASSLARFPSRARDGFGFLAESYKSGPSLAPRGFFLLPLSLEADFSFLRLTVPSLFSFAAVWHLSLVPISRTSCFFFLRAHFFDFSSRPLPTAPRHEACNPFSLYFSHFSIFSRPFRNGLQFGRRVPSTLLRFALFLSLSPFQREFPSPLSRLPTFIV